MELQILDEEWRARRASVPIDPVMRFSDGGLLLGAGTVISRAGATPRDVSINASEPRLLTLLAAAHLQKAAPSALAHIENAADRWRDGDDALAAMHLALSRLDRLRRPVEDAQRLFFADCLLTGGPRAEILVKAFEFECSRDELSKYSPDQPRVPAGSGRASGQWAAGGGASDDPSKPNSSGPGRGEGGRVPDKRKFTVELPSAIVCASVPVPTSPFTQAVKAMGDAIEVTDSITKWRELGPKGEAAIVAAAEARGWTVLGTQVRIQVPGFGLRVEDVMVHVPAGTAGNATAYDGFIEVKVNGGRYSAMQQMKDTAIYMAGGILLTPVKGDYAVGKKVFLGTGLATVTITYGPKR